MTIIVVTRPPASDSRLPDRRRSLLLLCASHRVAPPSLVHPARANQARCAPREQLLPNVHQLHRLPPRFSSPTPVLHCQPKSLKVIQAIGFIHCALPESPALRHNALGGGRRPRRGPRPT